MNYRITRSVMLALGAFLALGFLLPQQAKAQSAIFRLSSEFRRWDGTNDTTTLTIPGISVYKKTVFAGANTLWITMEANGDNRTSSAGFHILCTVDGSPCNGGTDDNVTILEGKAQPGWIHPFSGDTASTGSLGESTVIHHQWCVVITPGTHTIQIRMAAQTGGSGVFLRTQEYFIDTGSSASGCKLGTN